ncbi:MAG: hypothetical protein AB1898_14215 [Acidobacteriota bacterium]
MGSGPAAYDRTKVKTDALRLEIEAPAWEAAGNPLRREAVALLRTQAQDRQRMPFAGFDERYPQKEGILTGPSTLNHRERMLATLRGRPTDQIPWAPRMDLWYIALRERNHLPPEFVGLNTAQIADVLDVACHAVRADYTQPRDPNHLALRGFGIENHPDYPYRVELRNLPIHFASDGQSFSTRIKTTTREVETLLSTTSDMRRSGISIPFVKLFPVRTLDDLEAVGQVFENLEVVPTPDAYVRFWERIGHRGLAVASGPNGASPMHLILHDLMPMEQFFYWYVDERGALERLASRMQPFFNAILEAVAACAAEVVFWGANYDQDLTPPSFFRREILPWLLKAGDRLRAAGKFLLTHTDGENRYLLPLYPACQIDVAESVCPSPMTSCTLAEVRAGMGPQTTVWGGIPSVALLDSAMDEAMFEAYMDQLFNELGGADHLILGVSDNVPPDANLSRLRRIQQWLTAYGPVSPGPSSKYTGVKIGTPSDQPIL